jgi:transglutaminase-like putative cysteine protease
MKHLIEILLVYFFITSCQIPKDTGKALQKIENEMATGNFQNVSHLADSLQQAFPKDILLVNKLDSLKEMTKRISLDFSLTESEIGARLQRVMGEFTPEDKEKWEKDNLLEYRMINGEKRYFNRAASNLKLLLAHRQKKAYPPSGYHPDETDQFRIQKAKEALALKNKGIPVNPVNIKIKYTLKVDPDVISSGETIRCWMPFPKESHARQQNVSLIRTFPEEHFTAPDTVGQRSLYMEQKTVTGQSTVFEMELSYKPMAQYFSPENMPVVPYNTASAFYHEFTSEQKPHIVFTEKIRKLSDSIVGKEKDPIKVVRKIYTWINENIPWAGALEYSTMPNIPEYVLNNRHGDCGMQTLLFMTLARYNGIPVKWQSGWYFFPEDKNLHDWCEVFYEGVGWVPLDMSFGLLPSEDQRIREYYITGIDAYRFIVNDATGTPFIPAKRFMRSEPVDFQRGEVEWRGGNLYFDKWNYHVEVSYF